MGGYDGDEGYMISDPEVEDELLVTITITHKIIINPM